MPSDPSAPTSRDVFKVWEPVLVRWGDMDAFGHVNNARFFTYCESARIRYFETLGFDDFHADPSHRPGVVSASCNFRRQVHHPARLEVGARVTRLGNSSFTLEYGVFDREDGALVADGESIAVWVDYGAGKAIPLPEQLKTRIAQFEGLES